MKKALKVLLVLAIAGSVGFFVYQSQLKKTDPSEKDKEVADKDEKKENIYPVATYQVGPRRIANYISNSSTLKADRQVDIFSKNPGQIREIRVEEGQNVKAGDLLLVLDGDNERLKMEQSKVVLTQAKAEYERNRRSFEKQLVAAEVHDAKKFEFERAEAEYKLAAHQFEMTQVRAPFSGTITARMVEQGQSIQMNDKLFTLAALEPLEAEVFLTEAQAAKLRVGQEVEMSRFDDYNEPFTGKLTRIAPVVDRETGTVKLTVNVHKAPSEVKPGTYVHLRVATSIDEMPAVIPKKALNFDNRQNAYVFLVQNDKDPKTKLVKKLDVHVSQTDGEYAAIADGLKAGDHIVLTGKEALRDGGKVEVVQPDKVELAYAK